MDKKKILLLCTGGTIASTQGKEGLAPGLEGDDILKYIPSVKRICDIKIMQVCNIDSTDMTPFYWQMILQSIKKNYDSYDGFVILHGTDTMAYTAAALSYMIQNSPKPIVLTGSQKPICLDITDAKTNLTDSIYYVCDEKSCGVTVVFDGCVIAGTRAKKTCAHSYDAFSSVNFPIMASIWEGRIIRFVFQEKENLSVHFYEAMNDSIAILKLLPGSRPALLGYLFEQYDCLLIESFGVGGIPESLRDEFYSQMRHWRQKGKIVVIATQVVNEGSNMEVYKVGKKVKRDFGLIETYDMTLESAVTKMMHLMGVYGKDYSSICKGFYQTVSYDILYPDRLME